MYADNKNTAGEILGQRELEAIDALEYLFLTLYPSLAFRRAQVQCLSLTTIRMIYPHRH